MRTKQYLPVSLVVLLLCATTGMAQTRDGELDARADTAAVAAGLGSKEAVDRQQAAETLARLAAVNQKKLIEGYRLQEKDKNVRLALDWALYRVGKEDALLDIIQELDSSRHDQAVGYLRQLESPSLINGFLKRDKAKPKILVGLIEALAEIGDSESLQLIAPLRSSFAPGVSAAAEVASDKIEERLATAEAPVKSRPRSVGGSETPEP